LQPAPPLLWQLAQAALLLPLQQVRRRQLLPLLPQQAAAQPVR
jgi:hypothetical protein